MKKCIVLIICILMFFTLSGESFALEIEGAASDDVIEFNADEYIPDKIKDELSENGVSIDSDNLMKTLFLLILDGLRNSIYESIPSFVVIMSLIFVSSLFYKIIDNSTYLKIISVILCIVISINMFRVFSTVLDNTDLVLRDITELMRLIIPSFSAILLLGGGSFSAIAASASLGAILTFLEKIIISLLYPFVYVMFTLNVTEKLLPSFSELKLSSTMKKYFLMTLSFVTTVMLSVISFQNILGASKDSVSARALKFAASGFIPIVGGAVSESLKTVSYGVKLLKNTVGISFALSVFLKFLPILCSIFSLKLLLSFATFSGGATGSVKEKDLIEGFINTLDIINGIIICIMVLSILISVLFISTGFTVSVS